MTCSSHYHAVLDWAYRDVMPVSVIVLSAWQVLTTVEMAPLCSPHTRPGRPSPVAQVRAWNHNESLPQTRTLADVMGPCCKVCHVHVWQCSPLNCLTCISIQCQACRTLLPCIQQVLTEQVASIVERLVDARQLCIAAGKAAWLAYLDIYILDAGGTESFCLSLDSRAANRSLCDPTRFATPLTCEHHRALQPAAVLCCCILLHEKVPKQS